MALTREGWDVTMPAPLLEAPELVLHAAAWTDVDGAEDDPQGAAAVNVAGTAVGGTQEKYTVFIENCHVHVDRIVAALTGAAAPQAPQPLTMPES